MTNVQIKSELSQFLKNLIEGIENGHAVAGITFKITNEAELEKFIRVGNTNDSTFLSILGYDNDSVQNHPTVKVHVGAKPMLIEPDFVLHDQKRNLAVLDVKSPTVSLDNPLFADQVLSYCDHFKAPLGILFNGYGLRVFINPKDPLLSKDKRISARRNLFLSEPVVSAEMTDVTRMIEKSSNLTLDALQSNPIGVAKRLARKRIALLENRQRQQNIGNILNQTLRQSPPGDINAILSALANVDSLWTSLNNGDSVNPKVTDTELFSAWGFAPVALVATGSGRGGINGLVRDKIAEVCAKHPDGFDAIIRAQIADLSYDKISDPSKEHYSPVPSGPNIPTGLRIRRVTRDQAESMIKEIGRLM